MREAYGENGFGPFGGYRVELPKDQALEILDELAALIRKSVEPAMRQYLAGEKSLPLAQSDQIWRMHQIGQEARKRDNAEGVVAAVFADARAAGDSWQLIADALDLPTDKVQGRCDEAHYDDQ
jgi:hypothetical protein